MKKNRTSYSLKERFDYWFDDRIANGSLGFIRFLILASVALAVLIACLVVLMGFDGESDHTGVFWDSIATIINAWMPYSEDGSLGYLALMSINAIAGMLFTSVLIGIITSTIEERIVEFKRGNSTVLEKGHVVVLGFQSGEYTLLNQLILDAEDAPMCIVVGADLERETAEELIQDNLSIPRNVRIIYRTVDITDPVMLRKCAITTCRTVIVSPSDDARVIKTILAVSKLLQDEHITDVRINAILATKNYNFPKTLADTHNISVIKTNEILAKIIAHSCTQTGLSETFREVFNFEGAEFHLISCPELAKNTFAQAMTRLDRAVPAGVYRDDHTILNPPSDFLIQEDDRLIVFSETKNSAVLLDQSNISAYNHTLSKVVARKTDVLVVGSNDTLPIILRELPDNVVCAYLPELVKNTELLTQCQAIASQRNLQLCYYAETPNCEDAVRKLAQKSEHIVILSDHNKTPEDADMEAMFLLLNFRDVRLRYKMQFNITVEMCKEQNQKLVSGSDHTDFLVASSMASLFLAQLAEYPELIEVFRDILDNEGNELYLKNASDLHICGTYSILELRKIALSYGYILLGYMDAEKQSYFNLPLGQTIELTSDCNIIVLSED